jgi:hypothetical protein
VVVHSVREDGERVLVLVRLGGGAGADESSPVPLPADCRWRVRLTMEDRTFTREPEPPRIELDGPAPRVAFRRPGAAVLTA